MKLNEGTIYPEQVHYYVHTKELFTGARERRGECTHTRKGGEGTESRDPKLLRQGNIQTNCAKFMHSVKHKAGKIPELQLHTNLKNLSKSTSLIRTPSVQSLKTKLIIDNKNVCCDRDTCTVEWCRKAGQEHLQPGERLPLGFVQGTHDSTGEQSSALPVEGKQLMLFVFCVVTSLSLNVIYM